MMTKLSELLLEEPKKLQKLAFILCKTVLVVLFANWLFKTIVGNYNLIEIDNFRQWVEFILSGRILLCCFFYFISYLILFQLFGSLVELTFNTILTPKPVDHLDNDAQNIISWTLRKLDILDYDRKKGEVKLMLHSDELREYVAFFTNQNARKDITAYKASLLNEIGLTYLVFSLVYFLVLIKNIHNQKVTVLIIFGILVLIFAFWFISLVLELLHKLAPAISQMLDTATYETIANSTFEEEGYLLIPGETFLKKNKFIQLHNQKAAVIINLQPKNGSKYLFKQYKDIITIPETVLWIFTKNEIHPKVEAALLAKPELVKIFHFTDEDNLRASIRQSIKENVK